MRYTFDDFVLDTQQRELRRAGERLHLRPKAFQVLLYLIAHRDRVVPQNEILDHVWPDIYVSSSALSSCLKTIRRLLGDDGRAQRFIRTLRGYGYRFVSAVEERAESVEVHRTHDQQVGAECPATNASEGSPSPLFVACERELDWLHDHLQRALSGQGRVVFCTGEAGYGKTALMAAFARQAQKTYPALVVAGGSCDAFTGVGDPYLPFRDVLSLLSGDVATPWPPGPITQEQANRLRKLAPATAQALADEGPDLMHVFVFGADLWHRVAAHTSGGPDRFQRWHELGERERGGAGNLAQRQIFEQYTRVLHKLATQAPLLILLDDLQWADRASLNLLFHLGRRLAGHRLLIVGAYRPSDVALARSESGSLPTASPPLLSIIHEFTRQFGDIRLDVGQRCPAEVQRFVDALVDSEPNRLGEAFRSAIRRQTQGHPLFILELLRDMQERGDLIQDDDGYWIEGARLGWQSVPLRVEAVIAQRLERLEEPLLDILRVASVEGETFTVSIVAAALDTDSREIMRLVTRELSQRHRLVQVAGEVAIGNQQMARFQFTHSLFQHYLYARLHVSERQQLHGGIARALEALSQDHPEAVAVHLARHFAEAGQPEHAVRYLLEAGDQARIAYAPQEAIAHYQRACNLLLERREYARAARTLMKQGLTYQIAFDFQNAQRTYEQGFRLWGQAGDRRPAVPVSTAPHAFRVDWLDPPTLDPATTGNFFSSGVIGQLFCGLVELSPEMEVLPEVAHTWEVRDGGSTYLFSLRPDVVWSDGTPVTAHDFEYAWKRVLSMAGASLAGRLLDDIKGARALRQGDLADPAQVGVRARDDRTLEVQLEAPISYFPYVLTHPATYPVPRHVVEHWGAAWTASPTFVTNGPFRLASWHPGVSMTLVKNPAYRGRFMGNIERVQLSLLPDPFDRLRLYEDDHLDVFRVYFLPPDAMEQARQRHASEYLSGPQFITIFVGFDGTQPPFDNPLVRRAFALGTDQETFVNVGRRGVHLPARGGGLPAGVPGHAPDRGLPYDPAQARRCLAQAGYPEGRGFPDVSMLASDFRRHEAQQLLTQWHETLGVTIRLVTTELELTGEMVQKQAPPLFYYGWAADYPDPDNFLRVCVGWMLPTWQDPTYWTLIERARRALAQEERIALYAQADRLLIDTGTILPLYYARVHLLVKPWVKRYPLSVMRVRYWKDVVLEAPA
jgi:ABC-type oligopeptide transport system substrate-binding subunit/DNA-binding winged helix-turn-helix (wHTH) protein